MLCRLRKSIASQSLNRITREPTGNKQKDNKLIFIIERLVFLTVMYVSLLLFNLSVKFSESFS